jgi:protein-tyrosine phosphatase
MPDKDPRLETANQVHNYLSQLAKSPFNPPVSEIEPGFYLGGTPTPQFPKVDAVLNVSDKIQQNPAVSYTTDTTTADALFWMPIHDRAPFPGNIWLSIAVGIVETARNAGWTLLVHCDRGWSRSAMVVTAYYMKTQGLSVDDALDFVLQKRAIAPNPYFLVGLQDWETFLTTGQDTTSPEQTPSLGKSTPPYSDQ